MAKRSLLIALLVLTCTGIVMPSAASKGIEMGARNGVTVSGSPYRYVAISAHVSPKLTLVERIDMRDGRVDRWWQLPGEYNVPAVSYDGMGGGLSADGRTLVLGRFTWGYPPEQTRLAILDTELPPRRPPGGRPDPTPSFAYVDLAGHFAFDAISPDGSTIYLIHYLQRRPGADYLTEYEVRAFDVESRRLLPEPIVDPEEPEEEMAGLPIVRATSLDGRWAYTFYDSHETRNGRAVRTHEPFIHALDTVAGRAVCIDLPSSPTSPAASSTCSSWRRARADVSWSFGGGCPDRRSAASCSL
jgi:hypothetical protein